MENASKALIIAGAVLVTLMVISLGVYIFNNMSNSVRSGTDMTQEEITAFNNKLTPYIGNNKSGSQVNVLIQTAFSINQTADNNNETVTITKSDGTLLVSPNMDTTIKVETSGAYYKVEATYSSTTGLINAITVTPNS